MGGEMRRGARPVDGASTAQHKAGLAGVARQHMRLDRLAHGAAHQPFQQPVGVNDQNHLGIIDLDDMGDGQAQCRAGAMQDANRGNVT